VRNSCRVLIVVLTTATLLLNTVVPARASLCSFPESCKGRTSADRETCCCCGTQRSHKVAVRHQSGLMGSCCRQKRSPADDDNPHSACPCEFSQQQPAIPSSAYRLTVLETAHWDFLPPVAPNYPTSSSVSRSSGNSRIPQSPRSAFAQKVYCIWLT